MPESIVYENYKQNKSLSELETTFSSSLQDTEDFTNTINSKKIVKKEGKKGKKNLINKITSFFSKNIDIKNHKHSIIIFIAQLKRIINAEMKFCIAIFTMFIFNNITLFLSEKKLECGCFLDKLHNCIYYTYTFVSIYTLYNITKTLLKVCNYMFSKRLTLKYYFISVMHFKIACFYTLIFPVILRKTLNLRNQSLSLIDKK